jgi:RHS repeat-associated protein
MLTNVDEKSNINNPFKFTGAIHDKTANLYLMGSRYYNPKVGRFITQDSFGATYGADWTDHLYSYTGNNPVNFVDPTGHARLGVNGELTSYTTRNIDGVNSASLQDLANAIGANIYYYADSKQAQVTYNGREAWYSQKYYYTDNGRIQVRVGDFAKTFGLSVSWSGTGQNQIVNLKTKERELAFQTMKKVQGECHYKNERMGAPFTPQNSFKQLQNANNAVDLVLDSNLAGGLNTSQSMASSPYWQVKAVGIAIDAKEMNNNFKALNQGLTNAIKTGVPQIKKSANNYWFSPSYPTVNNFVNSPNPIILKPIK